MNGHRTCIICLPRTGSQLCEKLVNEMSNSYILGEFFENWNSNTQYELDADLNIKIKEFILTPSPFNLTNKIEEHLDVLKQVNPSQPLSIRLFIMDHYDKTQLSNIIMELKNIGFEFITLVRDIKEQLLSYMIAYTYVSSKNINVFAINSNITEPVTVDINRVFKILIKIRDSNINWERNMSIILNNIDYQKIKYETMYSDMSRIYNREFKYSGNKSINVDPFDLIVNKKEIKVILDILVK